MYTGHIKNFYNLWGGFLTPKHAGEKKKTYEHMSENPLFLKHIMTNCQLMSKCQKQHDFKTH